MLILLKNMLIYTDFSCVSVFFLILYSENQVDLRILLYRFKFFCITLRLFSCPVGKKKIVNPIQGRVNFSNPFWYLQMQTQNHHTVFAIWSKIVVIVGLLLCSNGFLTFFINKSVRSCCFFLKTPPVFYFSVYGSNRFFHSENSQQP